jgi:hypothetical protein
MILLSTTPSLAQMGPSSGHRGTSSDRDACRPAVFKFCRAALPDTFRILQCLQRNRPRIGKACQLVLSSNGV